MIPLLTTDWHLDHNPDNEYRWAITESVLHAVIQYKVEVIFILGDLVDRKDHHSGAFVNRLVVELSKLAGHAYVVILRGNHDTPLRGPAFWEFLSEIKNLRYITKPEIFHMFNNDQPDLLLLPFTVNPKQDWANLQLSKFRALFMHATVTGTVVENGQVMENNNFPILPRGVKIYSGDVHVPQQVRNITYVGAPHPIKFGDRYPCRMLLLNEEFDIAMELPLYPPLKWLADLTDVRQLAGMKVKRGDQVKIRFTASAAQIDDWGAIERTISKWAADNGVTVAGIETVIDSVHPVRGADIEQSPEQILRQFAAHEHISDNLLDVGLGLLKEVQ